MTQSTLRFILLLCFGCRALMADELESGFRSPPPEARPLTMAQWVNGNVSREGITADLESMKRVGLQGLLLFEVDLPYSPPGPVKFMSGEWRDLMRHTANEAQRLGLEFGFHNCPGWSSSGGPWITPELSMQKLVWSEMTVKGPMSISLNDLPQPKIDRKWNYYRDVALIAVRADGGERLDLAKTPELPVGDWRIFRFGHTTNSKVNLPAPKNGSGLECDKFNPNAVDLHFQSYVAKLLDDSKDFAGRSLNMVMMDSYESGPQDWTARFPEEFKKRRGYDILPWLPALAGVTLGSEAESLKFREDMRRTIAELFDEIGYGRFAELVRQRKGMKVVMEPYGGPFDLLTVARHGDLNMATFWNGVAWGMGDIRINASACHTWGKNVVGCEAFTGAPNTTQWNQDPYSLKPLGDQAFALGVNRLVLHTMVQQPWIDAKPGMTLGYFGTHFGRNLTWWEQSRPWFEYLSRCQFLLQQGHHAADVLMLDRQAAPAPVEGARAGSATARREEAPTGHLGDQCSEKALIERASVADGRLIFPDGMSYRLLVLPDQKTMTLPIARKLKALVTSGATIIGPRPTELPGLEGGVDAQNELRTLADHLWGSGKIQTISSVEGLQQLGLGPDFSTPADSVLWIHRRTPTAEIYFLSNQKEEERIVPCSFRIIGKQPELWDAATGEISDAGTFRTEGAHTTLPIRMDPHGSVFVVFRRPAASEDSARTPNWRTYTSEAPLSGSWQVAFDPAWGGPSQATFPQLADWTTRPESGIRFYSGTATYAKDFDLTPELASHQSLWLDLGTVRNLAEVELNGANLGVIWKPPFRIGISSAVRSGSNKLIVRITNLWPNRLIGDEQEPPVIEWGKEGEWRHSEPHGKIGRPMASLPPWLVSGQTRPSKGRFTVTSWNYFTRDSPLLPSGLLGPVAILRELPPTSKSN